MARATSFPSSQTLWADLIQKLRMQARFDIQCLIWLMFIVPAEAFLGQLR